MCYLNGLCVRLVAVGMVAFGLFVATAAAAPPPHALRSLPAAPGTFVPNASFGYRNFYNPNPFSISPYVTLPSPQLPFQYRYNQGVLNSFLYGTPQPFAYQNFFNPYLYGGFNPYVYANFNPYFNPYYNPYASFGFGNRFINPYAVGGGGF